jgi:hypothetical protein
LPNVQAVVPTIQSDSKLLSLPFGGAVLRGLGFRADDVDMLIEENRRTALGFFDEGVSTPAKPKKAPEKEPVPVEETVEEEDTTTEEEEPVQDEPKSLMEEVGVEETVVREEPKNATQVVEEEEPAVAVAEDVEKKPGSLEAQRAALSTIAELQREAFFAADARAEELLDANSTVLNATRAVIETSEILAGLDDDQCTVMSNGDTAENTTELNEFIEEEVAATDR